MVSPNSVNSMVPGRVFPFLPGLLMCTILRENAKNTCHLWKYYTMVTQSSGPMVGLRPWQNCLFKT